MSTVAGFGTIIEHSADGTTFVAVADLTDIKPPKKSASKVKTTTHSTPDNTHTYRSGLSEPGDLELKAKYSKTAYAAIDALYKVTSTWRITYTDGSKLVGMGYVSDVDAPSAPMDDDSEFSFKIVNTGKWVFTAAP